MILSFVLFYFSSGLATGTFVKFEDIVVALATYCQTLSYDIVGSLFHTDII